MVDMRKEIRKIYIDPKDYTEEQIVNFIASIKHEDRFNNREVWNIIKLGSETDQISLDLRVYYQVIDGAHMEHIFFYDGETVMETTDEMLDTLCAYEKYINMKDGDNDEEKTALLDLLERDECGEPVRPPEGIPFKGLIEFNVAFPRSDWFGIDFGI